MHLILELTIRNYGNHAFQLDFCFSILLPVALQVRVKECMTHLHEIYSLFKHFPVQNNVPYACVSHCLKVCNSTGKYCINERTNEHTNKCCV